MPALLINVASNALFNAPSFIKYIRSQGALTTEQIAAQAEAQDLQNKEDIKALLALRHAR